MFTSLAQKLIVLLLYIKNSSNIDINAWYETVKADVAGWLSDNGYTDTTDVLINEKQDGDIAALIAQYDKGYQQNV